MEAYLFFYSRLERFDYRLIYAPSESFLPDPIRSEFIAFAREVINTDNVSNGKIVTPRWSIIRREDKILYGIGIYNKELGDCSSELETRNIRGYFGIVFNYEKGNLPMECFTLAFFQNLYSSYFTPLWHAEKKDENKINSIVQIINIDLVEESICFPIKLNTNSSLCKVLSESVIVRDAINSAIENNDIEIVLGLNDIKHVTTASLSRFRNISLIGNFIEENISICQSKQREKLPRRKDSVVSISEQNRVRGSRSKAEEPCKITTEKESDYKYLADSIFNKLRKCGINVKAIVHYLAKKCGLCIIEPSSPNYDIPDSGNEDVKKVSHNYEVDLSDEESQKSMENARIEHRNRLAEIRKELSTSEDVSQMMASEVSHTPQNTDFHNLEELDNIDSKEKDNLSIEDLK